MEIFPKYSRSIMEMVWGNFFQDLKVLPSLFFSFSRKQKKCFMKCFKKGLFLKDLYAILINFRMKCKQIILTKLFCLILRSQFLKLPCHKNIFPKLFIYTTTH